MRPHVGKRRLLLLLWLAAATAVGVPSVSAEPAPSRYEAERSAVKKPDRANEALSWAAGHYVPAIPAEAQVLPPPSFSATFVLGEAASVLLPVEVPFALRRRPPPISS